MKSLSEVIATGRLDESCEQSCCDEALPLDARASRAVDPPVTLDAVVVLAHEALQTLDGVDAEHNDEEHRQSTGQTTRHHCTATSQYPAHKQSNKT